MGLLACGDAEPKDTSTVTPEETDTDTLTDTDTGTPPDTGTSTAGPDPMTVPLGETCTMEQKYGDFRVESFDTDLHYSVVAGRVADAVVPVTILEEIGNEGDCLLLRRNNPFCDPNCAPDETCDFGICIPYPAGQDLGTVSLGGLLEAVDMTPVGAAMDYFDTTVPHPPYAPGALVALTSSGGDHPPIELYGVGVEPLTLTSGDLLMTAGMDLALTWDVPVGPARSEIWAQLNVDQHGITPVLLTCETLDDGEFVVPASLIDALLAQGVTGYPNATVHRRTTDSAPFSDGCLDFKIASVRAPQLRVAGFNPCTSDFNCTPPQTCNLTTGLCE